MDTEERLRMLLALDRDRSEKEASDRALKRQREQADADLRHKVHLWWVDDQRGPSAKGRLSRAAHLLSEKLGALGREKIETRSGYAQSRLMFFIEKKDLHDPTKTLVELRAFMDHDGVDAVISDIRLYRAPSSREERQATYPISTFDPDRIVLDFYELWVRSTNAP